MNTKHTLTPWRVGDAGHTVFGPPNGNPAPEVIASNIRSGTNARLIVRAVNAHEALVAALQGALFVLRDCAVGHDKLSELFPRKLKAIEAALALAAEGKQ